MSWFLITLIAYLLNAVAMVIDKTLLKKEIPQPVVYVSYIALLGTVLMLFVLPFGLLVPDILTLGVALVAGAVFVGALLLMFGALKKDDATRVIPMIGGLTPIFVFLFAKMMLRENLSASQLLAGLFLIMGSFLISLDFYEHGAWHWLKKKLGLAKEISLPHIRKTLWLALPAAVLFGLSYALTKYVYGQTAFLPGFIWTRAGGLLAVILLFLIPSNRQLIIEDLKKKRKEKEGGQTKKTGLRFLFGQACGGGSALLLQYAIFLSSVTLVQALQGTQYVFVFLLVLILTVFYPKLLKEKITKEIFIQKTVAILIIFIGLWLVVK